MDVNSYYDKIFIINLESRKDRWKNILANLEKFNITNYERFNACFITNLENENKEYYKNFRSNGVMKHGPKYTNGALGCKQSHLEIMKISKNRNYNKILILEDDIFIREKFNEKIKEIHQELSNIQHDIVMFTGNHQKNPKKITKNLYKITETYCTMGYSIHSNLFDYILSTANSSGLEIDVYYCKNIYSRGNSYCVIPHLIGHIGGYSDISHKDRGVFKFF